MKSRKQCSASRSVGFLACILCSLSLRSHVRAAAAAAGQERIVCASARHGGVAWRGGGTVTVGSTEDDAYAILAKAVRSRFKSDEDGSLPDLSKMVDAFKSLSSAQKAFKGLDGAAHEAYQRTHATDEVDISASGRAKRSAARTGAAADGLGACELCELIEYPERFDLESTNGTLVGRQVLLNVTDAAQLGNSNVSLLVLYEPSYHGGSGEMHGGIEDLLEDKRRRRGAKGRLLVIVGDGLSRDLDKTLRLLEQKPRHVRLRQGPEVASVQPSLYKAAGSLLTVLESLLRSHNASAIHFTGRSLSGGIAMLTATILDGEIPMPGDKTKRTGKKKQRPPHDEEPTGNFTNAADSNSTTIPPLQGLGKGRASAISLGAPPCMSANVQANFATSILYGDDIVCRVSPESLERFFSRTRRALKRGGIIGKRLNWMTDTFSLATSNLQSHAVGSEGEEARLSIPGRAYLIRPRRLGDMCSMHEVGGQLKGGREALRAAVLWQLNDILLSRSLWKHHQLDSYLHGLDRVHLRGLDDTDSE
jgi:hypothetical protein